MFNPCDKCGDSTSNPENDFGEFVCDECDQNAAERAWDRFCSDFYGGADPLTIREQQVQAWEKFKR